MRCPNCGNENPPDYVFCDECGARLQPLEGEAGAEQAAGAGGPAYGGPAAGDGVPSSGPAAAEGGLHEAPAQWEQDHPVAVAEASAPSAGTAEEAAPVSGAPADSDWQEPTQAESPATEEPVPATEDTIPPVEEEPPAGGEQLEAEQEYPPLQAPGTYSDTYAAPPVEHGGPEAEGAPQAPEAVAAGGGSQWASAALDQFNQAHDALSKGDWIAFGTAMTGLRSFLENAVQAGTPATAVPPASVGPAPSEPVTPPEAQVVSVAPSAETTYEEAAPAAIEEQAPAPGFESAAVPVAEGEAGPAPVEPQAEAGTLGVGVPGVAPSGVPQEGEPVLARLVMIATGAELPIPDQDEITVGREDPSSGIFPDIDLTPYGGEEGGVSRRHARILRIGGEYYAEDMQSTNYTKLDGQRLPAHVRERLEDGARLDFGRVATIFRTS